MSASFQPQSNSDDGIDKLLHDYFRSKLPSQFPPPPLGQVEPAPRRRPATPLRYGRAVLAACVVAVVLGFGYLFSTANRGGLNPVGFNGTTATHDKAPHDAPPRR